MAQWAGNSLESQKQVMKNYFRSWRITFRSGKKR